MNLLLNYFIDLCLLRTTPQDLPASTALLWLTMLAYILAEMLLLGSDAGHALLSMLGESLFDVGIMLLTLQFALRWQAKELRFQQTATAILGSSALLGILIAIIPSVDAGDLAQLWIMLLLILFAWNLVVLGHILRHAFEITLGQGIMASIIYTLISYLVLDTVFPVVS